MSTGYEVSVDQLQSTVSKLRAIADDLEDPKSKARYSTRDPGPEPSGRGQADGGATMTSSSKRRTLLTVLSVLTAMATVSAAGIWWAVDHFYLDQDHVTMSSAQAKAKAEHLLADSLSPLHPSLAWQDSNPQTILNYRFTGSDYDGTARLVITRYVMTSVAVPKRAVLVQLVTQHWKQEGYSVDLQGATGSNPSVEASTPDGDQLTLSMEGQGIVSINATVGTFKGPTQEADVDKLFGPPETPPTDSKGNPVTIKLKDDPYWSH